MKVDFTKFASNNSGSLASTVEKFLKTTNFGMSPTFMENSFIASPIRLMANSVLYQITISYQRRTQIHLHCLATLLLLEQQNFKPKMELLK